MIYQHLVSLRDQFIPATVGTRNRLARRYRSNLTCHIDSLFGGPWTPKTRNLTKERESRSESPLLRTLDQFIQSDLAKTIMDVAPFPACKFRFLDTWETQVGRYGDDRQYYSWHKDRMIRHGDQRIVTLIYYVHKTPKKFSGGKLWLSNGLISQGQLISNGEIIKIEPLNDRLVIMDSRTPHCVQPTSSSSPFEDGRFAANVWIGKVGRFPEGETY